jgi:hypothetical protein
MSDDGKAQSIFSPHIKLVGQKIVTDIQLYSLRLKVLRLWNF